MFSRLSGHQRYRNCHIDAAQRGRVTNAPRRSSLVGLDGRSRFRRLRPPEYRPDLRHKLGGVFFCAARGRPEKAWAAWTDFQHSPARQQRPGRRAPRRLVAGSPRDRRHRSTDASLSATAKTAWLDSACRLATEAAGGATTIDVVDEQMGSLIQRLPLESMAGAAKAVGGYIATAVFLRWVVTTSRTSRPGMTWMKRRRRPSARRAARKNRYWALSDDAQLLVGTSLALLDNAGSYGAITKLPADALDDSFARDPRFCSTGAVLHADHGRPPADRQRI